MIARLAVIGAGGHGKVVADAASSAGWSDIVFLDQAWPSRTRHGEWAIVGTDSDLARLPSGTQVVVAIGDARQRELICAQVAEQGFQLATVVHPASMISRSARIGRGTVVFAGAVVNPDAVVGTGCIVNSGAIVEHDCVLEDGVHVCPGVSLGGAVKVGRRSWIGIGSSVKHGVRIGADVLIGAGSVVVGDIPDGVTAYGVPARVVR